MTENTLVAGGGVRRRAACARGGVALGAALAMTLGVTLGATLGAALAGCGAHGDRESSAREHSELAAENARLRAELESARSALEAAAVQPAPSISDAALGEQLAELRAALAREHELRVEREREWLRYTRAIDALGGDALQQGPRFVALAPLEETEPEEAAAPAPVAPVVLERSAALQRSLRALLAVEGVRGMDLLDAGQLGDGWIGPVVFRLLDGQGRLAGSLGAQRLRLAGSRTARTLTIVLEDGFESRGGVRTPFEPSTADGESREAFGVRRIEFDELDPLPWVQAAPELFGGVELAAPVDDGQWSLTWVRSSLNRLLRLDAARGYWRVKSLGGVFDGQLRDVQLEQFDVSGKLERRLFADRLALERRERGVALRLEGGALVRGDEKTPFLDGQYRIYLPRADLDEWNRAGLPGLTSQPGAAARADAPPQQRD